MRIAPSYRASSPSVILLVDDNQDGVVARQSVLEELGYNVVSACSGADALTHVEQQKFDLIITDYKMRPMDGLELISNLRKGEFQNPIVLLTGFADSLGLREDSTGANVVIQKSANEVMQLVRSIKRLLATPRKPAASQRTTKALARKRASAGDA
jgi:CheY-like chemotaxis protein